jgi:site-specific recombinase XerD
VDLEQGFLTLRDTKSGRIRYAYMTEAVKRMLQSHSRSKLADLVFPAQGGTRRVQISHAFRQVVNALGLNDNVVDARYLVPFHTLRHTSASWLVMRGTPLYTVQRLLGHQLSTMTERYSHLAPDHLRKTVKGFEEGLREHKEKSDIVVSIVN